MTTVNKKRIRNLSPVCSDSDAVDQENPKTHENGDACRGKRRVLGDTEDGVKSNTCFVCDGRDNWVLVCHGEGCPVAIHQSCTSDEPDFDEFRNFYCPYCWYKRLVAKSRNCRETLGGVDLGLMMDNVVEVNVSGGRRITMSVNPCGNTRDVDKSNKKCMVMQKNQQMKEVAAETLFRQVSETGDADVEEGRQNQRRFSEKNCETSDACNSNAGEGRKGRAICSEENHGKVQVRSSDVGEERKQQRRCDINHETAQAHCVDADVRARKQRRYSETNEQNKLVSGAHEQDIFINGGRTQARDSDLGEGRSGQGCFHENNQQKKALSSESCEKEVPKTDKRVSRGFELGKGTYRQGRHIEKSQRKKRETQEKEVSKNGSRKREGAVIRDGDEFYFGENQDGESQADMRNENVTVNEQQNGFRKDEQVEQNSVLSISSSKSAENVNDSNAASQELALIIHPNAGVQGQPIDARPIEAQPYCSVSSKNPSFQPEKYGNKSYLEKNGTASNDPGQRKFVLCSEKKRKRLFWTQAEEEMLRVGVQKFPGFRNIPWRKILEFGRDVFHDERAPSDLKDKWKNMNKMLSDNGKWVSLSTERQPNQ